jgi:Holliday junction DNA helicase RuvA
MIEYLNGTIATRKPAACVIDVAGVGYEVLVPMSTFELIPPEGKPYKFYIHHHVREDAELLFGFASTDERLVFRTLTAVSGVGPKLALAALSALHPDELRQCVASNDVVRLTRIPGVGRKTAERIIVELRDRLVPRTDSTLPGAVGVPSSTTSIRYDAILALEALGLARATAEKQVAAVVSHSPETTTAEELIRLALRER